LLDNDLNKIKTICSNHQLLNSSFLLPNIHESASYSIHQIDITSIIKFYDEICKCNQEFYLAITKQLENLFVSLLTVPFYLLHPSAKRYYIFALLHPNCSNQDIEYWKALFNRFKMTLL
jgi:hypothetical protein